MPGRAAPRRACPALPGQATPGPATPGRAPPSLSPPFITAPHRVRGGPEHFRTKVARYCLPGPGGFNESRPPGPLQDGAPGAPIGGLGQPGPPRLVPHLLEVRITARVVEVEIVVGVVLRLPVVLLQKGRDVHGESPIRKGGAAPGPRRVKGLGDGVVLIFRPSCELKSGEGQGLGSEM